MPRPLRIRAMSVSVPAAAAICDASALRPCPRCVRAASTPSLRNECATPAPHPHGVHARARSATDRAASALRPNHDRVASVPRALAAYAPRLRRVRLASVSAPGSARLRATSMFATVSAPRLVPYPHRIRTHVRVRAASVAVPHPCPRCVRSRVADRVPSAFASTSACTWFRSTPCLRPCRVPIHATLASTPRPLPRSVHDSYCPRPRGLRRRSTSTSRGRCAAAFAAFRYAFAAFRYASAAFRYVFATSATRSLHPLLVRSIRCAFAARPLRVRYASAAPPLLSTTTTGPPTVFIKRTHRFTYVFLYIPCSLHTCF